MSFDEVEKARELRRLAVRVAGQRGPAVVLSGEDKAWIAVALREVAGRLLRSSKVGIDRILPLRGGE